MRAAIYVRRSTEEHQAASLEVQIEEAKRYVASQGWSVAPEHIYSEDGVSRAEFKKRPALIAMINAAGKKAFDVVTCRDETRLGGDGPRTTLLIQEILDSDCRLFYYFSNEEVRLDDAMAKFMVGVRNFAAELEREKIASRTREHLKVKARNGFIAGGRCYGYDNVVVMEGERRLRVEYAVNPEQARVVREIFERYADGEGLKKIVKVLNARQIPSPSAGKRGTNSWSPSAIHSMLRRERYCGDLIWGKFAKGYKRGTKVRTARPESEWTHADAPELRIVDESLWRRVQARVVTNKNEGRPSPGRPPSHLLSGLARCAECGGPIGANTTGKRGDAPIRFYLCQYHRIRGNEACAMKLRRSVEIVDRAVIDFISTKILGDDVVADAILLMRGQMADRSRVTSAELPKLEAEATKLRTELANLVGALASGSAKMNSVAHAITERERKASDIEAQIRSIKMTPTAVSSKMQLFEREARAHVANLRATLAGPVANIRELFTRIFVGPLRFSANGKRYRIEGEVSADTAIFCGVPNTASLRG